MQVKSLTARQIVATLDFTDRELDLLSLAFSKVVLSPKTEEEQKAADTLIEFSKTINELLDRMQEQDGRNK